MVAHAVFLRQKAAAGKSGDLRRAPPFGLLGFGRVMHINRARGKRDFDLFFTKSRKNSFSHLMLNEELIGEFLHVAVQSEIQG